MLLAPNEGLKSALEILKSRYGNPSVVVEAWIRKITRNPKLDSSNICKFADDLDNCIKALTSLDCLNEMDNQQSIRTTVEKFPRYTQHRWTKENAKCKRTCGGHAKLTNLVTFVRSVEEEMTDPILNVSCTGSKRKNCKEQGL
ncbi:hypothetical protein HOLleu_31717 [Holothuria leucospilota]|uniref:Uncharacterized protein n=1 Tax=Holothuria leucospilota TaxID=206669 RepID=A0A9Q1BGG4_HOLLE|nr:hypothetical protein HOLleu_31717 [Holothuria leucospilota]